MCCHAEQLVFIDNTAICLQPLVLSWRTEEDSSVSRFKDETHNSSSGEAALTGGFLMLAFHLYECNSCDCVLVAPAL